MDAMRREEKAPAPRAPDHPNLQDRQHEYEVTRVRAPHPRQRLAEVHAAEHERHRPDREADAQQGPQPALQAVACQCAARPASRRGVEGRFALLRRYGH
ncbi:MAG: hypothetical protein M5R40_24755 [Anaerolineae bacterium]|nr:hypothetical protein [Anaerolineae bacterium]